MIYSHFFPPKRILLGWYEIFQNTLKQKQNIPNDLFLSPASSIPIWLSYPAQISAHSLWSSLKYSDEWSIYIWNFENVSLSTLIFSTISGLFIYINNSYFSLLIFPTISTLVEDTNLPTYCVNHVSTCWPQDLCFQNEGKHFLCSSPHWNIYGRSFCMGSIK